MTTESAVFLALALASLLFGVWMVVKKGWLQGCFLAFGAFICLGGISILYESSPRDKDEAPAVIALGVAVIVFTLIYWNAINRLTLRGPYKTNKE